MSRTTDPPRRTPPVRLHLKEAAKRCPMVDHPMEMEAPKVMPKTVPIELPQCKVRWVGRRLVRLLCPLAGLVLAISTFNQSWAEPNDSTVCESEMTRAAKKYDVPLGVLYAVALTETGRRGSLHPFALNIEGPSYFPSTLKDALQQFAQARMAGAKLIDIGCMQINYFYHGSHFRSVIQMFDPHENVDYAAQFLKELRDKEGSWTLAAARYHAGPNNDPAQKQYVCAVISNMVASGFGRWTATARGFCQ